MTSKTAFAPVILKDLTQLGLFRNTQMKIYKESGLLTGGSADYNDSQCQ